MGAPTFHIIQRSCSRQLAYAIRVFRIVHTTWQEHGSRMFGVGSKYYEPSNLGTLGWLTDLCLAATGQIDDVVGQYRKQHTLRRDAEYLVVRNPRRSDAHEHNNNLAPDAKSCCATEEMALACRQATAGMSCQREAQTSPETSGRGTYTNPYAKKARINVAVN